MKLIKGFICAVMCAVFALTAAACSAPVKRTENAAIMFTDDDGNAVALNAPAQRIISLYSAHTENIYSLGAGDRLIGNYHTAVYPPEAAFLDMYDYTADPEKVIAAEPDVVLIRPFITRKAPDFVKALQDAGICVVSLYPESFDRFDDYINKLAMLTGTEEKAAQMLKDFHGELDGISALTAGVAEKKRVFFESTETNIRTVTDSSMPGLAVKFAGGINIAAGAEPAEKGSSIAEFGIERVLENADNIDVYISQRGSMNSGGSLESIDQRAGYDTVKAVKDGRVYTISEKLISSPTFRYVKGVRETARFLYPELMDDYSGADMTKTLSRREFARLLVQNRHMQIYVPSSSKYYASEHKGHTYGLFKDVSWQDTDFDFIETAVNSGAVSWTRTDDGEYYYPDKPMTRMELAEAVFILGDFRGNGKNTAVSDIAECGNERIVQTLVDNGVFALNGGAFEPNRTVTAAEAEDALDRIKR